MNEPLDFEKEYVLADDCVLLRPLMPIDADLLVNFAINEPDLWEFSLVSAAGKNNMIQYIQSAFESREQKNAYPFIVFDKRTNEYIGSTRFYDIQPIHQTLLLGYTWYGKKYQGSGINVHCKFLLLQLAFESLGIERVEFRADAKNARSIAAMKSIGCNEEGVLRSNLVTPNGLRRDSIVLSILKEDWYNGVKEKIERKINSN